MQDSGGSAGVRRCPIVSLEAKAMPKDQNFITVKLQIVIHFPRGLFRGMDKKIHKNCAIYFTYISGSNIHPAFL